LKYTSTREDETSVHIIFIFGRNTCAANNVNDKSYSGWRNNRTK